MRTSAKSLVTAWDLVLSLAIGLGAAYFLPNPSLHDITEELIGFFGIQSATILPAMIFTAGLLRGDGVSVMQARRYQSALKLQMRFWITLLALDFVAVCLLITGKTFGWTLIVHLKIWHFGIPVNIGVVLVAATSAVIALCVFRIIPFVRGVMSLLEMNGRLVEASIIERETRRTSENISLDVKPPELPPGYGKITKSH